MSDMRAWIATFLGILALISGLSMFAFKTNLSAEQDHRVLEKHEHSDVKEDIGELKADVKIMNENIIRIGERLKVKDLDHNGNDATNKKRRRD